MKSRVAAKKIARVLRPPEPGRKVLQRRQVEIRTGIVTAVGASVSVMLGGDTVAVPDVAHLASYTPTVSDLVVCMLWDSNLIVLGEITT